jgi:hypothetical protein
MGVGSQTLQHVPIAQPNRSRKCPYITANAHELIMIIAPNCLYAHSPIFMKHHIRLGVFVIKKNKKNKKKKFGFFF